ncbi:Lrp/AsnC family transcriptional regulator [Porticoccaceae bacterium]|jgi:DNA-binding Lrp family transcriptional regulator|nr:Lrp/AsnC family transcriptional regulator [Porticoccaceae bacterium]MDB9953328.1 Lrp/AsnC family transcriptional regulator [Porticoccaceae bacterium]MDB9999636.1 Lrp/AsnC family transcriptional regulator [Porticoccaceae bacterium]MDC0004185.1 Lrp/AsnC family transcriptional regulator [Porticoccaceae bacterium]|tara:strand:+ start:171 stop:641 length:471 start_codon:yes stop_codon:yes gene_type:complete
MPQLDNHDRSILRLLQSNGKMGNQELAEKVNLSSSPCWRRVKKLEESGMINGYVAMLNPKSLGLTAMAYVHIALLDHRQQTIETLDKFVEAQEQIVECSSITGPNDYLLKIIEKDTESLEKFIMQKLLRLGIVRSSTTNLILRQKKYTTALPLQLA